MTALPLDEDIVGDSGFEGGAKLASVDGRLQDIG